MSTWFLDVDGVILPFASRSGRDWADAVVAIPDLGLDLQVCWRPTVVEAINAAAGTGHRVLWLTSWGEYAATQLAPVLGLDSLPLAAEPGPFSGWKADALASVVGGSADRFVWTDDTEARAYGPTMERIFPRRGLYVACRDDFGLTDSELNDVRRWLDGES